MSNASDALDKLKFLSVTEPSLLGDAGELETSIKPDPDNGTITITDTGIGMTKEEFVDCLGTIAQSSTSKFLKALKENQDLGADNGLIGQFGVGFYSAFLVAEKVIVSTKSPKACLTRLLQNPKRSKPEGDAKIDIPDGGLAVENGDSWESKWQLWVAMLIYLIWKASVT
ncbi:heat shock protein 90-5, chloroplastic-like [Vitis riparia]|uniref:heat shock protein 90-5, chloroplastic-like n=1 Tax=Vitis riparia TaxID=96939 RepID=UPI00155A6DAE|nr:heat shock protein 90-5, chloroplastic-like [Vitis riparia]